MRHRVSFRNYDLLFWLFCIPMHGMGIPTTAIQKTSLRNSYPLHQCLCEVVLGLIKYSVLVVEHRDPGLLCGYASIILCILRKAW